MAHPQPKQPLNTCQACEHTWHPRGHSLARRCPECGSTKVSAMESQPPTSARKVPIATSQVGQPPIARSAGGRSFGRTIVLLSVLLGLGFIGWRAVLQRKPAPPPVSSLPVR